MRTSHLQQKHKSCMIINKIDYNYGIILYNIVAVIAIKTATEAIINN